jgi:polysaccharide export outer membrane protein
MSALVCVSACHHAPYIWVQQLAADFPPERQPGAIDVGDVLEVRVFGQEALTTKGTVRQDGQLTMPLLGAVPVSARSPAKLAEELKAQLKPYVNNPEVTVVIVASQVEVAVVGQVRQVGVIQLDSPATVLHALARAGGMTDFADTSGIYVLRRMNGAVRRIRFSYEALTDAEPHAIDFHLRSGDMVVVE